MSEVNIKDIAVIISGAITAISTLSAVLITNYFNHRSMKVNLDLSIEQKRKELKIEKIEGLYLLFEKWEANLTTIYLNHLRVFHNKLTLDQAHELMKDQNMLESSDFQKIMMLMHVHFPELVTEYQHVNSTRKDLVPFLDDPNKTKLTSQEFCKKQDKFFDQCRIFKQHLSTYANEL